MIEELNAVVQREARKRPEAMRLMTHPGVGPITALAYILLNVKGMRKKLAAVMQARGYTVEGIAGKVLTSFDGRTDEGEGAHEGATRAKTRDSR
jgi:hypothetical protein